MNIITSTDIAKKFGLTQRTTECYLAPNSKFFSKTAVAVRDYARSVGYYAPDKKCVKCGSIFQIKQRNQHYCPACSSEMRKKVWKHGTNKKFYHNGCFHSRTEEQERMMSMREEGFSNKEIASKIGRDVTTIYKAIGKQPPEMSNKNKQLGRQILSQKIATRKQYVVNKQITAYNSKVDECKQKQKELEALQKEINADKKRVAKLSKQKIKCPNMDISILPISTLQ